MLSKHRGLKYCLFLRKTNTFEAQSFKKLSFYLENLCFPDPEGQNITFSLGKPILLKPRASKSLVFLRKTYVFRAQRSKTIPFPKENQYFWSPELLKAKFSLGKPMFSKPRGPTHHLFLRKTYSFEAPSFKKLSFPKENLRLPPPKELNIN